MSKNRQEELERKYCDGKCSFTGSEQNSTVITAPVCVLCNKCRKPIKEEQEKIEFIHKDDVEEFGKCISLCEEYINLLKAELDEVVPLAYTHGWRSNRYAQGEKLRSALSINKSWIK